MAKRGPKPKNKENLMVEETPISVVESQPEAAPVAPPQVPEPLKPERKHYSSFYEAWPNVPELRKLTQRHGIPRLGLNGEDTAKANVLIDEYQNG